MVVQVYTAKIPVCPAIGPVLLVIRMPRRARAAAEPGVFERRRTSDVHGGRAAAIVSLVTVAAWFGSRAGMGVPIELPPADAVAAGKVAAERGWFAAARRHWRDAEAAAGGRDSRPAELLARLVRIEAAGDAAAVPGNASTDAAHVPPAVTVRPWREQWRAVVSPSARPVIATSAGLVVWKGGQALHAVALGSGGAAWPRGRGPRGEQWGDPRSTVIFPTGLAAGGGAVAAADGSGRPAVAGVRCHAIVGLGDGSERLVCLDISTAAEGRLVWAADARSLGAAIDRLRRSSGRSLPAGVAAEGTIAYRGEPAADHESCAVVIATPAAVEERFLAVFRVADGRLAWVRPLPAAGTARGVGPRPFFIEDRIVVVTETGTLVAHDRQGTPVWSVAAEAAIDPGADEPLVCVAGDRIVVMRSAAMAAPSAEPSTVIGVDAETGEVVWRRTPTGERVDQLIAADGEGVVMVTRSQDGGSRLRRLAASDGRETATAPLGGADGPALLPAGRVCRDGNTLVMPVRHGGGDGGGATVLIELLDGRSLARRREPVAITTPAAEDSSGAGPETATAARGDVSLAVGGGRIVWASGGVMGCLGPEPAAKVAP